MKINLDKINKYISEIKDNNYLVIVEGKKDRLALNQLGIRHIITLENKPLFEIIESINEKTIVILTDLDSEGNKIFNKLRHNLQRNGIKLNNNLRKELSKTSLKQIEGLNKFIKNHS